MSMAQLQGVYHEGGDTPDFEFLAIVDINTRIVDVFGDKCRVSHCPFSGKPLDRELPVQNGDDDFPVYGLEATVNHQNIVVVYAGAGHGMAADAQEEGGLRVVNAVLIEVQSALHIVIGGRRKTRSDLADEDGAVTRVGCRIGMDDGDACAREFFNGLWIQWHFSVSPSRRTQA